MNLNSLFSSANAIPLMTVLGGALDYAKNIGAGNAVVQAAQRKQQGANFAAEQLEINAGQQQAAAQRTAQEQARIGELGLSRLRAIVAMQGGSLNDPSILGIQARINAEAGYREAMAIYQGDEAARGMNDRAMTERYMGDMGVSDAKDARAKSYLAGAAGLVKTQTLMETRAAKSMYEKYNPSSVNE